MNTSTALKFPRGRHSLTAWMLLGLALLAGCGSSSRVIGTGNGGVSAPTLTSISVGPPATSLAVGSTVNFVATGVYSDGTKQDISASVTWNTSNAGIASISNVAGSSGLATGVSPGAVSISAAVGGVSGSANLTVTVATLVSIGITPALPSIANGTTQQFTATGVYSDHTMQNLTAKVTWTSATPAVATISNAAGSNGLATAATLGSTAITANLGTITSPAVTLTVTAATLVSIAITPANASIAKGTTQALIATGTYTDKSSQVITMMAAWTSSNPAIASISNTAGSQGVATAVAQGAVTMSASLGGITGTTNFTVTPATLASIAVTPANVSVPNGTTQQYTAMGVYTDATTQPLTAQVTWTSSAPTIISISNAATFDGLASAHLQGTATITATLGTISGSTGVTVTPSLLVSIAITPATPSVIVNNTQQFKAVGTYSDASTQDITATAAWTSATVAVATISNAAGSNGLATGLTVGTSSITAASGTITSNAVTLKVITAHVYAVDFNAQAGGASVYQFNIGAGGVLAAVGTVQPAGLNPFSVAVDPSGHYAYVANYTNGNAGTVSQYTLATDGSATPMVTPTVSAQNGPQSVILDPVAPYVYVANINSGTLSQYLIGAGGALSPLSTPSVLTASGPASIAVNPTGTAAYVADYTGGTSGSVSQYTINGNAGLTPFTPRDLAAGPSANFMVVDPSGRYAYVANLSPVPSTTNYVISQYTINADGSLAAMNPATVATAVSPLGMNPPGANPRSLAVDPTGTFLYSANANGGAAGSVSQFSIGPTGGLTLVGTTLAGGNGPNSVAIDPTGHFLYVANRNGGTLSQFSIAADGTLTPLATPAQAAGTHPAAIATAVGL